MYKLWSTLHTAVVLAAVFLFLVFILLPFVGCDTDFDNSAGRISYSKANLDDGWYTTDTLKDNRDSLRYHAFDNLHFGLKSDNFSQAHIIDNIPYNVACTKQLPDGRIYSLMLVGESNINTQETAKIILKSLKNIIRARHDNYRILDQYFFVMDPHEQKSSHACFSVREKLRYDTNAVGMSYEYAGYLWDLEYKQIKVGYFIKHDQSENFLPEAVKSNYVIYIEITNKELEKLLPHKDNPDSQRNLDSQKF